MEGIEMDNLILDTAKGFLDPESGETLCKFTITDSFDGEFLIALSTPAGLSTDHHIKVKTRDRNTVMRAIRTYLEENNISKIE